MNGRIGCRWRSCKAAIDTSFGIDEDKQRHVAGGLIAPAYQQAEQGQYDLVHELEGVFSHPYDEVPFDWLSVRPPQAKGIFNAGGVSHYSCSS